MVAVQTYRGLSAGWQTVSVRPAEDAIRLYGILQKVRPDWTHRMKTVLSDGTLL